jgi:hypothetical protein
MGFHRPTGGGLGMTPFLSGERSESRGLNPHGLRQGATVRGPEQHFLL